MYSDELSDFVDAIKDEIRLIVSATNAYRSEDSNPSLPNYSPDALAALYKGKGFEPSGIDWRIVSKDVEMFCSYRMQSWRLWKKEKEEVYFWLFD